MGRLPTHKPYMLLCKDAPQENTPHHIYHGIRTDSWEPPSLASSPSAVPRMCPFVVLMKSGKTYSFTKVFAAPRWLVTSRSFEKSVEQKQSASLTCCMGTTHQFNQYAPTLESARIRTLRATSTGTRHSRRYEFATAHTRGIAPYTTHHYIITCRRTTRDCLPH